MQATIDSDEELHVTFYLDDTSNMKADMSEKLFMKNVVNVQPPPMTSSQDLRRKTFTKSKRL